MGGARGWGEGRAGCAAGDYGPPREDRQAARGFRRVGAEVILRPGLLWRETVDGADAQPARNRGNGKWPRMTRRPPSLDGETLSSAAPPPSRPSGPASRAGTSSPATCPSPSAGAGGSSPPAP